MDGGGALNSPSYLLSCGHAGIPPEVSYAAHASTHVGPGGAGALMVDAQQTFVTCQQAASASR